MVPFPSVSTLHLRLFDGCQTSQGEIRETDCRGGQEREVEESGRKGEGWEESKEKEGEGRLEGQRGEERERMGCRERRRNAYECSLSFSFQCFLLELRRIWGNSYKNLFLLV